MTLAERYELIKAEAPISPARAFLREVAEVTKKSELAVRRWIAGETLPDALTQEVLARHFKTTPEELFPKQLPSISAPTPLSDGQLDKLAIEKGFSRH